MELAQAAAALAQTELEIAQCNTEDDLDEEFETERSVQIEQWVERSASYVEPPVDMPPRNDIRELTEAIMNATRISAPQKCWDLPDFNGAFDDWLPFKRAYEDTKSSFDKLQNLTRLRKAVKGSAKETVRSLLFIADDPEDVMKALGRRFGKPEELVLVETERIKELPRLNDNPRDTCVFASRISNAVATIQALKKPQYLYSPELSRAIVEKFTPILRYRWYDFKSRRSEDEPELLKLKTFLDMEADLCGDAVLLESKKRSGRHQVHAAHENDDEHPGMPDQPSRRMCDVCEGDHWLTECRRFKDATINQRWDIVKQKKLCFQCLKRRHTKASCRGQPCRRCRRPHHSMLHADRPQREPTRETQREPTREIQPTTASHPQPTGEKEVVTKAVYAASEGAKAYLKMLPVEVYGSKGSARVLALLDEGSTVTLLDARVAEHIGAVGQPESLVLETVGGKIVEKKNSQKMDLRIRGLHRKDKKLLRNVRTVDDLRLSSQRIRPEDLDECQHLRERIRELVYEDERPMLLIGQDNWNLIVSRKVLKGKQNQPAASLTSLGWVLHGRGNVSAVNSVNHCSIAHDEGCIEAMIKKHFELDALGIQQRRPSNDADEKALETLRQTVKRRPDGRFEAGLLWKSDNETLPCNYRQALSRLQGIERKLEKNAALKEEYSNQIGNLLRNGYAEEAPEESSPNRTFYLPHFAVTHPTKKKIRIVFDAAAKFQGKSLNDALLTGPDLLQSLFGVLLRFRQGSLAVVADIKEMFLQIKIRETDRDSLRFLWRDKVDEKKPKEYRMTSVIFGAASSPATAIFVKNLNASEHEAEHPEAAAAIVRNHYMDDYLQSFNNAEEAARTIKAVSEVHKAAGFELRQWASNDEEILRHVVQRKEAPSEITLGKEEEKTLGLRWLVKEDAFAFNIGLRNTPEEVINGQRAPTKREVTSAVMSTFDPMGLVAPILIKGKRLIQEVWRAGSGWDEAIGSSEHRLWTEYIEDIKMLKNLRVPRNITPNAGKGQLHTFVDASETAYAAVCYWRTETDDGETHVKLIAGKARVAPVKSTSIPRLELQAALLGGRLAASITREIDLEVTSRVFWSDSSTVLQWMKSDPRRFKTFVAHRLAELEDITKPNEWRWIPSKENPADDATRNVPKRFNNDSRWFNGPSFLYRASTEWPKRRFEEASLAGEEEMKKEVVNAVQEKERALPDPARFSTWSRLLRATARIFMFIGMCRKQRFPANAAKETSWKPYTKKKTTRARPEKVVRKERNWKPIDEGYLQKAETALLTMSQAESFEEDIKKLKNKTPLDRSSKLKRIDVAIHPDGLVRLNSRTKKIMVENRDMAPVILDGKHQVSRLIIDHYHRQFLHGNHATVINEVRQKYWILGLRGAVKKMVHQCQWCKVRRSKPQTPIIGDLPEERLHHKTHPFTCAAVDYFGPMSVTVGRRREKRWGVLFTCLTTRAVHLELAASLSTSSMIMALRRLSARRGSPKRIYSDNGTNFVGADRELRDEWAKIDKREVEMASEERNITWKFIPPGAPHMGGAWERMIRTVKVALAAVLFEKHPPEEVLYTLLTEVEHTVNSRPLTHISSDPADEESLTPNHFLIGRSCGSAAVGDFNDSALIGKADWKTAQLLADHFWRRWLREYLPTLMPRKMGGREAVDPEEGDIVVIVDSSLPRNTWPRGEVVAAHRGPDGRTRIVDVRTAGGIMRRPTSRLIIVVPRAAASSQERRVLGEARTGGETVDDAS